MKTSALFTLCLLFLCGCNSIFGTKTLRIGTCANFPPVIYQENGEFKGLEADFANHLAKEMNVDMRFVNMPWNQLIPALKGGKVDMIMAGMSITRERCEDVVFTFPYLDIGQMALMKQHNFHRYGNPRKIVASSASIGVEAGTTGEKFVDTQCAKAKKVTFDSITDAIEALKKDQVDLIVFDGTNINHYAQKLECEGMLGMYQPLTHEYLAWAVRRDDTKLLEELNKVLRSMCKSSELGKITRKWFPYFVSVTIKD